jgi:hypothetical protein
MRWMHARLHQSSRLAAVAGVVVAALGAPALAQKGGDGSGSRLRPLAVRIDPVKTLGARLGNGAGGPAPRGGCPETLSSYTDANFQGGSFAVQAGFAEGEIAAVSYVLPASAFPIKIDLAEMIFATSGSSVTTTTAWSFLVWQGTPDTGTLEYEFSSDGKTLPHIVIPPGTNGVNVQVSVDPGDPDQLILQDPGNRTFTIGYRIDHHNNPPGNPCTQSPPTSSNAFPTTDTSGLSSSTNNWVYGLNCGPFGCPANGGWARFSSLASFCRPSGDWVMRVTWESVNCSEPVGACCLPTGACEVRTQSACTGAGGTFQGNNVACGSISCPQPVQACCFPSTGGCLNLTPTNCAAAGGTPGGAGTACATFVCFPRGACCLPNGSCVGPVSPTNCQAQGGTFQGNATTCGTTNCPVPMGACCFAGGFCLSLTSADCTTAGGAFQGVGTTCSPEACPLPTGACCFSTGSCLALTQADCTTAGGTYNGDGSVCGKNTCAQACPCDFNDSGTLNSQDFFDFLACFFTTGCAGADFNDDGQANSQDFFDFLACFFAPPSGC